MRSQKHVKVQRLDAQDLKALKRLVDPQRPDNTYIRELMIEFKMNDVMKLPAGKDFEKGVAETSLGDEMTFARNRRELEKITKPRRNDDPGQKHLQERRGKRDKLGAVNDANVKEPHTSAFRENCFDTTFGALTNQVSSKSNQSMGRKQQELKTAEDVYDVKGQFNRGVKALEKEAATDQALSVKLSDGPTGATKKGELPDLVDQASLLKQMREFPSGTQFAVNVVDFAPPPGRRGKEQHTLERQESFKIESQPSPVVDGTPRSHWVYAEKYGNKILFEDYQLNVTLRELGPNATASKTDPARVTIDEMPRNPVTGEASYNGGRFIALEFKAPNAKPANGGAYP